MLSITPLKSALSQEDPARLGCRPLTNTANQSVITSDETHLKATTL